MTRDWLLVLLVGLSTVAIKASGPLLAGHGVARRADDALRLLTPALLAALVAVLGFTSGQHIALDGRAVGLAAAATAVWGRLPTTIIVLVAMVTTALARAIL